MARTSKKAKPKPKKEKDQPKALVDQEAKTPEGIPDVDFKKFLGCG